MSTMPPPTDTPWGAPSARPGQDHPVPMALLDGVALVGWSLLGQLLVVSVVLLGLTLAGVDPTSLGGASLGAVTVVTQSLVLAGAFAWLSGRGAWSWRLFGAVAPALRHVGAGLVGGVGAFLLSGGIILAGNALLGPIDSAGQALLETDMLTGTALLFTVLAAVVLAPLLEEVTFRGVLFQVVGRRTTWLTGAVLSSAVFSVVHAEVLLPFRVESLVFGLALFAVGMVLAVVFHRSRSLVAAMVAHATFNGVQILLATSVPDELVGFVGHALGA